MVFRCDFFLQFSTNKSLHQLLDSCSVFLLILSILYCIIYLKAAHTHEVLLQVSLRCSQAKQDSTLVIARLQYSLSQACHIWLISGNYSEMPSTVMWVVLDMFQDGFYKKKGDSVIPGAEEPCLWDILSLNVK